MRLNRHPLIEGCSAGSCELLGLEGIMMHKALNINRLLDVNIGEACYFFL